MAVRSKRLWGPTSFTTGPTTLYTAAAGETVIIKQLTVANTAVAGNLTTFFLNGNAGSNTLFQVPTNAQGTAHVEGLFLVLNPGDFLRATNALSGAVVAGFGAELEGFAD